MSTESYRGQSGTRVAPGGPRESRYALKLSADFTFLGNPENYDVFLTDKGAEILPVLCSHLHQAGLEGNDARTADPSGAIGMKESKGFVKVPKTVTCTAFGEAGQGYTHWFRTESGGEHWTHVWRRPYRVGTSVRWETDREGYWAFLRQVQADHMPDIDPSVLRGLRASLEQMLRTEKLRGREAQAEIIEAKLAAFEPPKKRSSKKAA